MHRFSILFLALFSYSLTHAEQPNVVILLADDLGYKDIGSYEGPVKTPALDKLASNGTGFQTFYSGCAVCSPSRATLLTGRHHIRAGVYSWINDNSQYSHLLERELTIAELLKDQGYGTAHVGKWHLGLPTDTYDKPTPAEHGFDYWFATWNNANPSHRNPDNFIRNGEPVGEIKGYACQIVVDEAIAWLDEQHDSSKPFFLNVWFHEPHQRIATPDTIVSEYGELKDQAAIYSGTIDNTDRAIARLVAKLEAMGVFEDTLIIYMSDNGSYREERTGNLRGKKGANWEGGIRVPGIFHWPGKIKKGQVQQEPGGIVDILPTLCGLLDIEAPADRHIDGSNLTPLLSGKKTFNRHQPFFWHLQRSNPIVAMRSGNYSLVAERDYELSLDNMFQEAWIPVIKSGEDKNFQLFDLSKDPSQENNIAASEPARTEQLKQQLYKINASIMADGPDWHLRN